jgi:hypothetical protein
MLGFGQWGCLGCWTFPGPARRVAACYGVWTEATDVKGVQEKAQEVSHDITIYPDDMRWKV